MFLDILNLLDISCSKMCMYFHLTFSFDNMIAYQDDASEKLYFGLLLKVKTEEESKPDFSHYLFELSANQHSQIVFQG